MKPDMLARFIAGCAFVSIMGGTWDTWMHDSIGPDVSIFSIPHLLIALPAIAAMIAAFAGWRKTKRRQWLWMALGFALVPLSAPFDVLWHETFGPELSSSVWVVWSPPHAALVGGILIGSVSLLPIIRGEKDPVARQLFSVMTYATALTLIVFFSGPFIPFGPFQLMGPFGQAVTAFWTAIVYLHARRSLAGVGVAFMLAIFVSALTYIGYGRPPSHDEMILAHDHVPGWLMVFGYVFPAILIDLTHRKWPNVAIGAVTGFLTPLIVFSFARDYFLPEFWYGNEVIVAGVLAGTIGGFVGGALAKRG
jgi:hypothetical protein